MKFGFFSGVLPLFPLVLAQADTSNKRCRCLYGEPCWPSEQEFASLASNLSRPLIRPVPPASACYPVGNPSGNCSDAQLHSGNGLWRADRPGAYQVTNFEQFINKNGSISACYLNTTLGMPCSQGNVPPVGIEATTVGDVQAAVRFVARHNLRLVVKNTGHDFLGRSAGRGAFMIWTHHLKNISYDTNFIPEGGSSNEATPALTLGAGIQWREAYAVAEEHQRFIVGGISSLGSVGSAGGWIMGGGHSALSAKYGLGVDNALQFTIVKPDGDHVVANAHRNPDLFWALRGGGAGSWGVVTSVTYRTYDLVPLIFSGFTLTFPNPRAAQTIVTEFIRLHPKLSDAGWGGYSSFSKQTLSAIFLAPNVSWADANATTLSFLDLARNVTGEANADAFSQPFKDFHEWNPTGGNETNPNDVGGNVELASRLLSRDAAEQRAEETAKLLLGFDSIAINFVAGGAVARGDPDSVGLHPGWRKALGLVFTGGSWEDGDSVETIRRIRQQVTQDVRRLEPISPDSATYMNEASLYEPDFRKSFFGSHYDKLRTIKRKYDPKSLFVVAEGVGSEEWDGGLTCRM